MSRPTPLAPSSLLDRIRRLLAPRTAVFVGGREVGRAIAQCRKIGFKGDIRVVNPVRESLQGYPCQAAICELEPNPDAAFVAVPARAAVEVVRQLREIGCGGAVVYSSGFAEVSPQGADLQAELVAAAGDMPLLGPNCWGFVNYLDAVALWPDLFGGTPCGRGVAIISQSGNLAITLGMQDRSLRVAYVISVGNQAHTKESDLIETLISDRRVSAIGLLIEGLSDVARFDVAMRRTREAKVPVVVLKTGRSKLGAELALSHTATLSGDDAAYRALFERHGVAITGTPAEFLETLKLLDVLGPLPGRRLFSMSCSGGEAALMADIADQVGLDLPALTPEHAARLAILGKLDYRPVNPFDYHTYVWVTAWR